MILRNLNRITTLPLWVHGAAAIGALLYFPWIQRHLNASYAASNHPVDYATGQTSFSGPTLKKYYAEMQEAGTLDVYVTTQLIDFGFILAIALLAAFLCTLIARIARPASVGRKLGLWAGAAAIWGAMFDALENGLSFVMLANPSGFADWLAIPYSGFASIKFALITSAMLLLLASLAASALGRISKRDRIG